MTKPRKFMPRVAGAKRGRMIALVALFALGQAVCAAIAAFATRDVFLALRSDVPMPTIALIAIALTGVGIAAMRIGERVIAESVGQNYAAELRKELFTHLSSIPASIVREKRNGGLALRFVGDLSAVKGWVSLGLARLISASIVLPSAALVLYLLDPLLALAAIVPIAIGLCIMSMLGSRLTPLHKKLRSRRARLAADMSERVPVAAELRLLGRLEIEHNNLAKRTDRLVEAALQRAFSSATLRAIPDIASGTAGAAVLFFAIRSQTPAPIVAGALAALGLLVQPMRSVAGVWDKNRAWQAARIKCERLLAIPRHADERHAPFSNNDVETELAFRDVSAGRLKNVTASVSAGKSVAIVGGNGAGKSTLLHLAAGIDRPEHGRVTVAGEEPQNLPSSDRRNLIALMSKSSPVLAGSLRRALTMGSAKRPDDETVTTIAQQFGVGSVVERLGGLDGKVAEGGRNLSSGEVRRLLLARLALSKAQFLLLDEPDDAVDARGIELIANLIKGSAQGVLVITHSLTLARRCDEVWVIEDGELTLRGSPGQILARGSKWAFQMGEEKAA